MNKAGKYFMFGFNGLTPTSAILDFIRRDGLAGVILFQRNIESREQLIKLTHALQDAAGGDLLIGIDEEGGRICHIPESIMQKPPSMGSIGRLPMERGMEEAYGLGFSLGEGLLQLGINLNFAPVLDVNTNSKNPIIGDRSFSSDPEIVSILASALESGMKDAGIMSCGKHFPGHGETDADSHKSLPVLQHDKNRLDSVELVPFRALIDEGIPALMTAHVVYKGVDPENPATLSEKILKGLLRDELGFAGILFSDDLEMNAITSLMTPSDAAVMAIKAGCDICLICHTESEQRSAIEKLCLAGQMVT